MTVLTSESQTSMPHDEGGELHIHVVSLRTLWTVFAALVALTIVTVAVASIDVGQWEVWVSIGIASFKGILVALYFMHLRWDSSFNSIVFIGAILCLALFLGLTLADVDMYQPELYMPGE